jgi:hypothetical protein
MAKKEAVVESKKRINLAAYLPQGMDEGELLKIGGLRPIAAAQISYEQGTPVAGFVLGILDMPPRDVLDPKRRGEKEPWEAVLVELTASTYALVGGEEALIEAGKEVIIPVNANLANNRELRIVAEDPDRVHWCLFVSEGQVDLGKGLNPMWDYDVRLAPPKHSKPRTGRYRLRAAPTRPTLPEYQGEVIGKDGQPVPSLIDN